MAARKKKEAPEETAPPSKTHNARTQIKGFVQRIERLNAEIETLREDAKEVYEEVKSVGLDAGALRKVIAQRKRDRRPPTIRQIELAALVDDYTAAAGE